jgi:hypothetical protein
MIDGVNRFHWDLLLTSIEEGRIVPVLGPELLRLGVDGQEKLLHTHLAERLIERLGITHDMGEGAVSLNRVASSYLEAGGHRAMLYSTLHTMLAEDGPGPPEPLVKLARIRGLRLFVSTTFDSLMERALDEVRHGGQPRTAVRVFSLRSRIEDIPCEPAMLSDPLVFHIFGRSSTAADFVVTDEDLLEFVHVLHTGDRRPSLLFDALRDYNLLVLGCSFPDWLTRFFVRVISDMRLLEPRGTLETIVDDHTVRNQDLVLFLRQAKISVFAHGGTVEFVDELCRRWEERHPGGREIPTPTEPEPADGTPGGIFLSYASEDRDAVLELKRRLEEFGLEVWFDQRRLEAGDVYERKIQRNIEACSFFFPIVSASSCGRLEGYYRKEWYWAIERSRRFDGSFPFIQPIVIDDTPYEAAGVPDEFSDRHWQRFPGGTPTAEFLELTKQRIRELRKREAGRL